MWRSRSAVMAKSTSMMPFFLTMPISRMMPMMPITDRSMWPRLERQQRADAGRRQRRQNGQRMDEAFVEHAEDDVDDDQRGARSAPARSTARSGTPARCPGRSAMIDGRHADLARRLVDGVDGLAERDAGLQVERHASRPEIGPGARSDSGPTRCCRRRPARTAAPRRRSAAISHRGGRAWTRSFCSSGRISRTTK